MIGYFDTSAFLPMLIAEPSSDFCGHFWNLADTVVTTRLLYVEASAGLAQAFRMDRISAQDHRSAITALDQLWAEFDVVEADEQLVRRAAQLARLHRLRGYDAVHCASAEQLEDHDLVFASGDAKLLAACVELGIATADINRSLSGATPAQD